MIYGNKLLNSDNLAIVALEQDVLNIHESLKYIDDITLNEGAATWALQFIDWMSKSFKEVLIKILDAISKLLKKVLPFIYNTIQKLITSIMNSMRDDKFAKTKFEGKKEFKIYVLNDKACKLVDKAKSSDFEGDIEEMENTFKLYPRINTAANIDSAVKDINSKISKFNDTIHKKIEPFEEFLSFETFKEYYNEESYTVESAIEYEKLRRILEEIIDKNKSMKDDLSKMNKSINDMITNLNSNRIATKVSADFITKSDASVENFDIKSLSKIPKLYGKFVDMFMGAIKSEVKAINDISKYGRYSEISITLNDEKEDDIVKNKDEHIKKFNAHTLGYYNKWD